MLIQDVIEQVLSAGICACAAKTDRTELSC